MIPSKFTTVFKAISRSLAVIMLSSVVVVTHSQGYESGSGNSMFAQIRVTGVERSAVLLETPREDYGESNAMAVWRVVNPVPSNGHSFPPKDFRDPFSPIKKSIPVSELPTIHKAKKPSLRAVPLPGKLLSVVHGPRGYQAVIRLSPKEYLIVEPGETIAQTGWRVDEIKDDRVRLEWIQSTSSSGGSRTIKSAHLFFK